MDLGIRNKTAIVCAASRGLGLAVATRLAKEGAKVAICARNMEALNEAVEQINPVAENDVFAYPCDVTDPQQIDAFHDAVVENLGTVDILVTNAGGPPPGTFQNVTSEQWQAGFDLTLMSAVHFIHRVLPAMQENGWGRILAMTSISARQPLPNMILSNAIRASVIGAMKTLADEVAGRGINVNSLCPGFILTSRMEEVVRAQAEQGGTDYDTRLKQVEASIPVGRLGKPEEFADMAAFLVSERASFVTGSTVLVDGGMYRGLM